jgi:MtN3 and saliva related transmembrane protein
MTRVGLVGMVAAICTTVSFLPQVIKVYRTKHTSDLSLPMYIIFSIGVFMWMCYGFLTGSLPIILANAITLVFCAYILAMKMTYK